jgi:hypothetical protein
MNDNNRGLAWLAEIVFFGSYFISWIVGAFNALTVTSSAHTFVVISSIAALVIAILLLFDNGRPYWNRQRPQ